ncbi:universal stress protein [Hymenobacter sp. 15J16-1T3B]|uniref:universal stress protein n=1 Tax=Hymenobacter sp. 15J16-1T3B TaxID=2886941 RepID=UPI001D10AEA1|nr:universal stress protein [Hymenobacter sp. 15J16-1T3B]MCC3156687.1 universal stress protein [Hymenobacter sp. 15J16-1T3B]
MAPTLLVLAGFYPPEQRAIRYADALASAQGGRLVLLHARRASLYDPYIFAGEAMRRQELADDADTAALLAELGGQLHAPTSVELLTDLLPQGLAELTQRYAPALFVLGLPAAPDASPEQLSHTTLELLRAAQFPVLLVPETTTATEPPQRVLIAADREGFVLTPASAPAAGWLRELGAEVTVAHVSAVEDDAGCARALRAVQGSGLIGAGAPTELRGSLHAQPAAGLLSAAADAQADLLVLLARPRSYLGELFHRSVTAQVLHRSALPVLLLPVAEPAEAAAPQPAAAQSSALR